MDLGNIKISKETNLSPQDAQDEYRFLCGLVPEKDSAKAIEIKDRKAFIAGLIADRLVFSVAPPTTTQEYPLPNIGQGADMSLDAAITEKKYLESYPKPKYGWSTGYAILIESRITSLNSMIAETISAEKESQR